MFGIRLTDMKTPNVFLQLLVLIEFVDQLAEVYSVHWYGHV